MITADVKYRTAVFNLLHTLKLAMSDDSESFSNLIEHLEQKFEQVPLNDLEKSTEFFFEVTNELLKELEESYSIVHEEVTNNNIHADTFKLTRHEDISEMIAMYIKYRDLSRFRDSFLQNYDSNFWRKFRSYYYRSRLTDIAKPNSEGDLVLTRNEIKVNDELLLPKDSRNFAVGYQHGDQSYFSNLYRYIQGERKMIRDMQADYSSLTRAVEAFNEQLSAIVRESYKRFGIDQLKELLTRIVVPVSLLEDEDHRNLCISNDRKVFVKTPTMDELMHIGMSVHVYAAPDMDDASFIAKPVLVSEVAPTSTEDLVYLGVGQYTSYNTDSIRSLNGENPYVINNNLFVKATYEDFLTLLPKNLVKEMRICEKLVETMDIPLKTINFEENEFYTNSIDSLKEDNTLDPKKLVKKFISSISYFVENDDEAETGPIFLEEQTYEFESTNLSCNNSLLNRNPINSTRYVVLKDASGNYGALKELPSGEMGIHITQDIDQCFRALELPAGLYSIYSFRKRDSVKQDALLTMHNYRG